MLNKTFFNEYTIRVAGTAAAVVESMAQRGVLAGVPVSRLLPGDMSVAGLILVANSEVNTDEDRAAFIDALKQSL